MVVETRGSLRPLEDYDDSFDYPAEALDPVPESREHQDIGEEIYQRLRLHFADDPSAYVSGNDLIYFEKGVKTSRVSPDAYVVFGAGNHHRPAYKVWEEGKGPDVVIEVLSPVLRAYCAKGKRDLYRDVLKVTEYFRFDPTAPSGAPALWGDRLQEGRFVRLKPREGRIRSERLGADLVVEAKRLQFYDAVTGERWLTPLERGRQETLALRAQDREYTDYAECARRAMAQAVADAARADRAIAQADRDVAASREMRADIARLRALLAN